MTHQPYPWTMEPDTKYDLDFGSGDVATCNVITFINTDGAYPLAILAENERGDQWVINGSSIRAWRKTP